MFPCISIIIISFSLYTIYIYSIALCLTRTFTVDCRTALTSMLLCSQSTHDESGIYQYIIIYRYNKNNEINVIIMYFEHIQL